MSKQEDLEFLKMHFDTFGKGIVDRLKYQYDKKGMSFRNASLHRMCTKLTEEVGEVAAEIFKDGTKEDLISELLDVVSVAFMLYINVKETE